MTLNFKKTALLGLVILNVVACAKKSDDRAARAGGAPVSTAGNATSCAANQPTQGRVFDNGGLSSIYTFEQRVKGLLSANVDPQFFGTISGTSTDPQTGVTIEGRLRYDAAGNVLLDQSNLKLTVIDSYVGQKDSSGNVIQAYPINFNAATAGTMNLTTKAFTLLFKDEYGEVSLTGTVNGTTVTGTISYKNYVTFDGSSTRSEGPLGVFNIETCAWIN